MRKTTLLACVLLTASASASVGCARRAAPAVAKAPAAPVLNEPLLDGRPVLVRLVGRDHVVTVTAGEAGPLYSAVTRDGVALADGVTLIELRERHPDVYRIVHPATAMDVTADNRTPAPGNGARLLTDRPANRPAPAGSSADRFSPGSFMSADR